MRKQLYASVINRLIQQVEIKGDDGQVFYPYPASATALFDKPNQYMYNIPALHKKSTEIKVHFYYAATARRVKKALELKNYGVYITPRASAAAVLTIRPQPYIKSFEPDL